MSIQSDIYNTLIASTYITDYVGTRVFPTMIPQSVEAFPTIVYTRISNVRGYPLSGDWLIDNLRYQFDVFAVGYDAVRALADNLHTTMRASTYFTCIMLDEQDLWEPDYSLHRVSVDYSIWDKK